MTDLIGHNNPPDNVTILRERLSDRATALFKRRDELLESASRVPAFVTDEETCGKVADLVKLIMANHKASEAMRVAEKEPFLESGRAVDGFFKTITDPLETAKSDLSRRLTTYQRLKAEEERRRREDAERLAREEERRARAEADARAAALKTEADLAAAITADELAKQATADAIAAQKHAVAKPAELSRSRGDFGSVASLRTFWDFTDLDRNALDLESLRQHIPLDGLEKAVRAFIKSGGRELRGVKVFENSQSAVR